MVITKKPVLVLLLAAFLAAGFLGLVFSEAQAEHPGHPGGGTPRSPTAGAGSPKSGDNSWYTVFGLYLVSQAAWILKGVASIIFGLSGMFLDNVLNWNYTLSPAQMPAVQIGWTIFRDMANGLFILIILWIAFTIVLNIENLGGRKLLFKVLVAAALVNFSLLFTTLAFEATNLLAKPFVEALPHNSNGKIAVGDHIAAVLEIQAVEKVPGKEERDFVERKKREEQQLIQTGQSGQGPSIQGPSFKDTLLASVGVQQAEAYHTVTGATAGCLAGAFIVPIVGCVGGAVVGGLVGLFTAASFTEIDKLYKDAITNVMGLLFYLVGAAALFTATIGLLIRVVAMIFLPILSPLVFLAYAAPIKQGKKYMDMWLESLWKEAFFAPIFFMLFYLSILMIDHTKPENINPALNLDRFGLLIVALILMIASVKFARQTAGGVSDTIINVGKGALGLAAMGAAGVATGGASLALTGTKAGAAVKGAIGRIESQPGFGKYLTRPFTQRALGWMEDKEKDVEKRRKNLKGRSSDLLESGYKSSLSPREKAAYELEFADRGEFHRVGTPEQQTKALERLQRMNLHRDVLEKNPHLITNENARSLVPGEGIENRRDAIRKIVKKSDQTELGDKAYDDTDVQDEILRNPHGGELARLARYNTKSYKKIMDRYEEKAKELATEFDRMDKETPGTGTSAKNTLESLKAGNWGRVRKKGKKKEERGEGGKEEEDFREPGGYL